MLVPREACVSATLTFDLRRGTTWTSTVALAPSQGSIPIMRRRGRGRQALSKGVELANVMCPDRQSLYRK
jgi:hypothetical protein